MPHDAASGPGPRDDRRERGAALAELMLVLPVMLALLLVVFDFGRGFLAYISITDSARDGARAALAAAIEDGISDCTDSSVYATIQTVAKSSAAGSDFIAQADVVVPLPTYDAGTGECEVTVSWTYTPIIPFVTTQWQVPIMGTIGPLWDGDLSASAVAVTT